MIKFDYSTPYISYGLYSLEEKVPITASSWHENVREQYIGERHDAIENADSRRVAVNMQPSCSAKGF